LEERSPTSIDPGMRRAAHAPGAHDAATVSFFDSLAGTWDEKNPVDPVRLARILREAGVETGQAVLDVGTGTGRLVPHLLRSVGPRGAVVAVDPSPGMLTVARGRHSALNLLFLQARAEKLPLPGEVFDRAICYSVFPHFVEVGQALAEIRRVLRPGGAVLVAHSEGRGAINRHHRHIDPAVSAHRLPPAAEVAGLMESVGLNPVLRVDEEDLYLVKGVRDQRP